MRRLAIACLCFCAAAQASEGSWAQAAMDMAPGCRVQLSVPNKAQVSYGRDNGGSGAVTVGYSPSNGSKFSYADPLYMSFLCVDASADLTTGSPVRFDQQQGKWVKDADNFLSVQVWVDEFTLADKRRFSDAVRFFELLTTNAQGYAYTQDDITGEVRGRRRQMFYCVFHRAKAICGESTMGQLSLIRRNSKNDLTPYALRILRSIEFLDDSPAPLAPN
jgi:hypothetical protein